MISIGAEAEPAALMLDPVGMIRGCNGAAAALFGYANDEISGVHVSKLLPRLAEFDLMCGETINPRLRFLCRSGEQFHAIRRDGARFAGAVFVIDLGNPSQRCLHLIVRRAKSPGLAS
ncbi:MAG: PAS domain S-box protein [Sterolibacterium sp.]